MALLTVNNIDADSEIRSVEVNNIFTQIEEFFNGTTSNADIDITGVYKIDGNEVLSETQLSASISNNITSIGDLTSGSISNGFGNIDIGSNSVTANSLIGTSFLIGSDTVLSVGVLGSSITSSSLTSVGALDSGSITSNFNSIDIGSSSLTCGSAFIERLAINNTNTDNLNFSVLGIPSRFFNHSSSASTDLSGIQLGRPTLEIINRPSDIYSTGLHIYSGNTSVHSGLLFSSNDRDRAILSTGAFVVRGSNHTVRGIPTSSGSTDNVLGQMIRMDNGILSFQSDLSLPVSGEAVMDYRFRVDSSGNLILGGGNSTDILTNGNNSLKLHNGSIATSLSAHEDAVTICSRDISDGHTQLEVRTEGSDSSVSGTSAQTHGLRVHWNGRDYYLMASTTAPS